MGIASQQTALKILPMATSSHSGQPRSFSGKRAFSGKAGPPHRVSTTPENATWGHPSAIYRVVTASWVNQGSHVFGGREGRNCLLLVSVAGVGGVGVSPPPPLFDAWLVAISSKCRSCWARSRGNSCLMAPMLLS